MKVLLCTHFGEPEELELTELPVPEPTEGQVRIGVKACSVNFPDVLMLENKYQRKPPLPFAPGMEVSGLITAVGPGVTGFKIGDRVASFISHGGMAEEALAPAYRTLHIPEGLDFEMAAAFTLAYATSYHALKDRAELKAGETLVVLGAAGGVGLAAVEIGAVMGARVIAGVSSQDKLALAKTHGASDGFLYRALPLSRDQQKELSDTVKAVTDGGADVIYDPIGDAYTEPCFRAIAKFGRYLVVGFAAGEIPKLPLNLALLKSADIRGVNWNALVESDPAASRHDLIQLAQWIAEGKLKPHIGARFPLERGVEALRMIKDRRAMGKIIVTV
jgi:NADPH2:quinone reductase